MAPAHPYNSDAVNPIKVKTDPTLYCESARSKTRQQQPQTGKIAPFIRSTLNGTSLDFLSIF